jgi:hypothetical protein
VREAIFELAAGAAGAPLGLRMDLHVETGLE